MGVKIITLLTDFGIQDHYVAAMKGVILGICPEARIIDISHMVPPQDIRAGSYLLKCVYRDFPEGTIHVAVVDPGVGTTRRGLAIQAGPFFFVGPDNGLFSLVLSEQPGWSAYTLEDPTYQRRDVSSTFHGRDVFAPAAAHIANGTALDRFGLPCVLLSPNWTSAAFPFHDQEILGEIIHVDHFGNCITNITAKDIQALGEGLELQVQVRSYAIDSVSHTYGEVEPGGIIALIGSCSHLEIAVNQGSAARRLGIRTGDSVSVRRKRQ